ncbi:MAG: hypothetical protein R3F20_08630 [Planctomycetota bacterium]
MRRDRTPLLGAASVTGVEIRHADGALEVVRLGSERVQAIDRGSFGERADLGGILLDALFATDRRRDIRSAVLTFEGPAGEFRLHRDWENDEVALESPGGARRTLADGEPSRLLGLDRASFRRSVLIRGGDHGAVGAGRESLGRGLQGLFGLPVSSHDITAPDRQREIESLVAKRSEIDSTLRALDAARPGPITPEPPPEMGELLEALEEARTIDRRLVARRLDLARTLDELADRPQVASGPSPAARRELKSRCTEVEKAEAELDAIRVRDERNRRSPWLGVALVVGFLAASGLMLAGHMVLNDRRLAELGLRAAIGVAALGVAGWVLRSIATLRLAGLARRAMSRVETSREHARRAVVAAGGPADLDQVDSRILHRVIDRLEERSALTELKALVAPFVDDAAEITWLRQLETSLAADLAEIERDDPATPSLPLVRATDRTLALLESWQAALGRTAEAAAARAEEGVRVEVEREMLQSARKRLEARITELRSRPAHDDRDRGRARTLARRLEAVVVPALVEILGEDAPRTFGEDLVPTAGPNPDAETNSLVLLLARILVTAPEAETARGLGVMLVDPGIALSPAREAAFLAWLAREPRLGRLTLMSSRTEILAGMRRRAGGDWRALVHEVRALDAARPVAGPAPVAAVAAIETARG